MRRSCLILVMFLFSLVMSHGQQVTISGYISDAQTGEKLIGATVVCIDDGSYAITNGYGYYAMKRIPATDTIRLQASFLGYIQDTIKILPDANLKIDFELISDIVIE